MPDAVIHIRKGEIRPVFGQETLASGTMTVSTGATVTLYDAAGTVVTGFNGINVTGYDSTAVANPRVWLLFDTTSAYITAGMYAMVFHFTAVASDSTTRVYEPSVAIQVLGVSS